MHITFYMKCFNHAEKLEEFYSKHSYIYHLYSSTAIYFITLLCHRPIAKKPTRKHVKETKEKQTHKNGLLKPILFELMPQEYNTPAAGVSVCFFVL